MKQTRIATVRLVLVVRPAFHDRIWLSEHLKHHYSVSPNRPLAGPFVNTITSEAGNNDSTVFFAHFHRAAASANAQSCLDDVVLPYNATSSFTLSASFSPVCSVRQCIAMIGV
jgi:hypothetical protein